jgi:hypothetical protein
MCCSFEIATIEIEGQVSVKKLPSQLWHQVFFSETVGANRREARVFTSRMMLSILSNSLKCLSSLIGGPNIICQPKANLRNFPHFTTCQWLLDKFELLEMRHFRKHSVEFSESRSSVVEVIELGMTINGMTTGSALSQSLFSISRLLTKCYNRF